MDICSLRSPQNRLRGACAEQACSCEVRLRIAPSPIRYVSLTYSKPKDSSVDTPRPRCGCSIEVQNSIRIRAMDCDNLAQWEVLSAVRPSSPSASDRASCAQWIPRRELQASETNEFLTPIHERIMGKRIMTGFGMSLAGARVASCATDPGTFADSAPRHPSIVTFQGDANRYGRRRQNPRDNPSRVSKSGRA